MEPVYPAKQCPKCHYWNDGENKFCRECGTKLEDVKNYCPQCDKLFYDGEKFCVECGTKLIAESEYSKPTDPRSYNIKYQVGNNDSVVFYPDSSSDEYKNKTPEELQSEYDFVVSKYEDCKKTGDYMTPYYKEKKDILEGLLGIYW